MSCRHGNEHVPTSQQLCGKPLSYHAVHACYLQVYLD